MKPLILILNGPNLNMLGIREPHIYGTDSLINIIQTVKVAYRDFEFNDYQSNHEGELIDILQGVINLSQESKSNAKIIPHFGVMINPGAYGHYSYALRDCLETVSCFKIEVHISNVHTRENFRSKSVISEVCDGVITGLGVEGYLIAAEWFRLKLRQFQK